METKQVKISLVNCEKLDKLKIHPRQSYDEIITALLKPVNHHRLSEYLDLRGEK
jgi:hypothetical protein